jgi:hypothetical protein
MQVAEEQLGADLASALSDQELIPFGVTGMLTRMQQTYRETVSTTTIVDSTRPIRFMLGYSGISHSSLETLKLIDGQILLRGDFRLCIKPGNNFPGKEVNGYLAESANRFVTGSPGTGTTHGPLSPDLDGQNAWRQNVSTWWLMQASDMLRQAAPTTRRLP